MPNSTRNKTRCDPTSARFGQRIELEIPVRISVDGRTLGRGTIRNASVSGALIESALELPLHTNLIVTVLSPGASSPADRDLNACLLRIDPVGFAVEWRDMAGSDVTDLLARASRHD